MVEEQAAREQMSEWVEETGELRSSAGMIEGMCPVCKVFVVSSEQKRYQVFDGFRRVLHEKCV
jgi:hypothetical protein